MRTPEGAPSRAPTRIHGSSIRAAFPIFLFASMSVASACRSGERDHGEDEIEDPPTALVGTEPRRHGLGEVAEAADYTMSVEAVEECAPSSAFAPEKTKKVVGVKVTLDGATKREVPVNPFYATLVDRDGESYSSTLAGCRPGLRAERLVAGRRATGFISFVVPKAVSEFKMSYAPTVIGAGREELVFELRQ